MSNYFKLAKKRLMCLEIAIERTKGEIKKMWKRKHKELFIKIYAGDIK